MIKKLVWDNHPVLGNLELDFTNSKGKICNTIVLAGENGTGKTSILETLAEFLNIKSFEPFSSIIYEISDHEYKLTKTNNSDLGFHQRQKDKNPTIHIRIPPYEPQKIDEDFDDIRHYGCIYSKARSGFNTKTVTSVTTQQLDNEKRVIDNSDDFTSIKQLLVDIDTQDNSDWMKITKTGQQVGFDKFHKLSKLYRFEKAFNKFFEHLKFKEIDNTDPKEKKIVFEKDGNRILIDQLSTGEKQIVFRGAYLLKNSRQVDGGIVLIDEPELSMHPKWQQRILKFYCDLFSYGQKRQTQIIFATHSEGVISEALKDQDNTLVVVLNRKNDGNITAKSITAPIVLPTITAAEINYLAFDIISSDLHIQLYGFLQSKHKLSSVAACDNYILNQSCYKSNLHDKPSNFKKTNYKTLPTYIRNAIDHPDSGNTYTTKELKTSIELLIELCK